MVSVAQGRREREGFAEWWFYSPTEAIITHFMRKLGSRVRTEGRASMVAKNLWIFRNVAAVPPKGAPGFLRPCAVVIIL